VTTRSKEFLAALEAYDQENNELALRLMEKCAAQGDPFLPSRRSAVPTSEVLELPGLALWLNFMFIFSRFD
jgi:hypothetical protein